MITELIIKNFKSVRFVQMPCKRINVIIGEPNSGKSNILEALALQSQNAFTNEKLNTDMFRYKTVGDLYYDFKIEDAIAVITNVSSGVLEYEIGENGHIYDTFRFTLLKRNANGEIKGNPDNNQLKLDHSGRVLTPHFATTNVRFYEYKRLKKFQYSYVPFLYPPYGENLPTLLLSNNKIKKWVSDFYASKGFILTLKPTEQDLTLSKMIDGELYSYPYFTVSETLQRIVFYEIAILSNKDAVLLFDEPESNTFPFYTKFIAEQIALDENNNQYFITTHNPYLLLSLIEKTPFEELNVCIATMEDYETKLTVLDEAQIREVIDLNSDVFFNFDNILAK
jgi:AAA15 family ATPase/GTPase